MVVFTDNAFQIFWFVYHIKAEDYLGRKNVYHVL